MMKRTCERLISLTLILILVAYSSCHVLMLNELSETFASADWLDGWKYRRQLTINSSLVDESLTNFPVLVVLDTSFFDFTKAKENGEDIRFTSSDGTTLLAYEIERWDKNGGKAEIWVKIPSVSDISDTDFFIYYGNPDASDAQSPANVWDSCAMVLHMKEASGTRKDSTLNNNDGTPNAVTKALSERIDGADSFDGSTSYINVLNSASLNFGTGSFSYSFWFYSKAGTTQDIIDKKGGTATSTYAGYKLTISSVAETGFSAVLGDGTNNVRLDTGPDSRRAGNVWAYFTVVVDRALQTMVIYIDGESRVSASISSIGSVTNTNPLRLGSQTPSGSRYFNGYLDEVRIYNVARSAAWVKASYNSEKNTLLTYGSEESATPVFSNIAITTTRAGALCEFQVKWSDPDGLDTCIFSTNNTGIWQNQTVPVSGTESWANVTLTLNGEPGVTVGYRWYCNDTLGNVGDTDVRALVTTGDWQYAMRIWFNNEAGAEDLINFPVMVNLTRARGDFWNHVGQTPKDLRFVDSDGVTDLHFEVEYWNYAAQEAIVWVNVPKIDAGSTSDYIYVYYGNPSPPESPYFNSPNVWDSGFKMVQHLEETSGTIYDSTADRNDGTCVGAVQNAAGKVDGAYQFDGIDDYIWMPHSDSLNLGTSDFTISVWVKYPSTNGDADILRKGNTQDPPSPGKNYKLELSDNRIAGNLYDGTNARVETTEAYGDNNWHFVVFCRQAGTIYLYVDGSLKASQTGANQDVSNTATFSIGSKNPPVLGDYYEGLIDEVWICNVAHSEEWIKAQYRSMNDQFITFNKAPDKPFNPSPAHGSSGIPTSTILSVNVSDPDGDLMDVYFYQPGIEAPSTPDFTIIMLPDTQYYSQSYPQIFDNQTQWIVNNKESMNIVFVTHEGDIVEIYGDLAQWQNANNSMSKLDNVVPWGILPGNHDGVGVNLTNYNTYFGYERFSGKSWYGGAYQNDNANSYQLFSVGADDYLVFHFQYAPSDDVLAWANATISNYPNRRVIVVTHDYLGTDGSRSTNGEAIWQKFVKPHADQIFLVLGGHATAEARRTDIVDGHVVYQLLADYQSRSNGGNGWLRILRFSPVEDKIYVKTYSPYLNSYETDSDSEFTLDYNMTSSSSTEPTLIGVDTDVPSGGIASVSWTGLNYSMTYSWYAIAYDTQGAFRQSDTWNFTTAEFNMPPIAFFTENATIVFTYDVIHFDASGSYDPDGSIVSYTWDFGDGINATGVTIDHSYANNGTYIVTLTVTDDKGTTASTNASKTVLNRPNITVEAIAISKSIVGQGYTMNINVTVANQGDFTKTFNVTVYANITEIETREITLTNGESTILTFTLDTSGFVKGNYTIWAYAEPVQGETDTADNTFTNGWVYVGIPGDINADGIVDIYDLILVANAYGSNTDSPTYNPNTDINNDTTIDIYDLIIVASHFGETEN